MSLPGTVGEPASGETTVGGMGETVEVKRQLRPGLPEGDTVGRYIIKGKLGSGGMGIVYAAFDPELDRNVAIKVLHPLASDDPGERERPLREARAMARLSHPNVVTVHDVGAVDDRIFIAMEHVEGETFESWLEQPRRTSQILDVLISAGQGLAEAHERGLVHRDFKPANVMIGRDGRVLVMDFGLALAQREASDARAGDGVPIEAPMHRTRAGTLLGTPAYMAPEQFRAQAADARSDQFAFCVSAYEALFGERPFRGKTAGALFLAIAGGEIVEPSRNAPPRLREILLRGLEADADDRYPDMNVLLGALAAARRRPAALTGWLIGGLFAVGATIAVAGLLSRPVPCRDAGNQIAGAWNRERANALEGTMTAGGSPVAEQTFGRVRGRLDRYAEDWATMRKQSCRATHIENAQTDAVGDLRAACLDRRARALDQVVTVLEQPDDTVIRNAVTLVADLEPVAACGDIEALQAGLPPPADAATAAALTSLRAQLDRVRALRIAGRFDDAVELATELQEVADELDYGPATAEALVELGVAFAQTGAHAAAEETLSQAYFAALRDGHDAVVAEAASQLTYVVGYRLARYQDALRWGEHALAAAVRVRDGGLAEALALHNLGAVRDTIGQELVARGHYERAYALRVELLDPDHPDLGRSLNALGNIHLSLGEFDAAFARYTASLELRERALGPNHPDVAGALNNLALVLKHRDEFGPAADAFRRAIGIKTASLGPDHPDVAQGRNNLGNVLRLSGDPTGAIEQHERALAIRQAAQGLDHPDVGDPLVGLGRALSDLGRHDEAVRRLEQGLALYEQGLGPDHSYVGTALFALAKALARQGTRERAREILARSNLILARTPTTRDAKDAAALARSLSEGADELESGG